MNASAAILTPPMVFKKATWRETSVLLAVAWFVPFAVHLVPWSGPLPLGAHLLPMFWTTFVGAYLFGARIAVLTGLFAPAINLLVTGLPALAFLAGMSVELTDFALAAAWAVSRFPRVPVIAPLAFVGVNLLVTLVRLLWAGGPATGNVGAALSHAVVGGGVGLAALVLINFALIRLCPKSASPAGRE